MDSDAQKAIKKAVRRSFALTILTFIGFEIAFGWVHEAGHGVVCMAYGLDPEINLVIFGTSYAWCNAGTDDQRFAIGLGGGLVGAGAAGLLAFTVRHRYVWMFIAATSTAIGHLIRAVLESSFHSFYITQQTVAGQIIGVSVSVVLLLLIRHYIMKKAKQQLEI